MATSRAGKNIDIFSDASGKQAVSEVRMSGAFGDRMTDPAMYVPGARNADVAAKTDSKSDILLSVSTRKGLIDSS